MQTIKFNDGYKTYSINDDDSRTIRINILDLNMKSRYEKATKVIEETVNKMKSVNIPSEEQLIEFDAVIREQLNYVFGSDICTTVFGVANVLTPLKSGKFLFESFMEVFVPMIEKDSQSAINAVNINIAKKTDKYIKPIISEPTKSPQYVGMTAQTPIDISNLSNEQKNAILAELLK